jgi:hypothetical protein
MLVTPGGGVALDLKAAIRNVNPAMRRILVSRLILRTIFA